MDPALAGLIGALGGSLLGGGTTWLASEWTRRRNEAAAEQRDRHAAYQALLTSTFSFVMRAQTIGTAKRFRSGMAEGVGRLTGSRKALDPFELHDWFDKDMQRLNDAWSAVWAIGSQEAIDAGDALVTAANEVLEAAIADDPKRNKVAETIAGAGWSAGQRANFDAALRRLAEQRVAFVKLMRSELGEKTVEFALERARREEATKELERDQEAIE